MTRPRRPDDENNDKEDVDGKQAALNQNIGSKKRRRIHLAPIYLLLRGEVWALWVREGNGRLPIFDTRLSNAGMTETGGDGSTAATPATQTGQLQSLRSSLSAIALSALPLSKADSTAAAPPEGDAPKAPGGDGDGESRKIVGAHVPGSPDCGSEGGAEGGTGNGPTTVPGEGAHGAAAKRGRAGVAAAGRGMHYSGSFVGKQAEEHLSCKYTKEELMVRHWGMNLEQMKRVKALLRMGVCEDDLEIADRLLKIGRDISNETPLTKEEQLLGYTLHQRQRMKALQILGLTEESFERCRAVMLSSLGPSAFGFTADETAASAARAEAEEGWTPGDMLRRKAQGKHFGGDGGGGGGAGGGGGGGGGGGSSRHLRMPTLGGPNSQSPNIGTIRNQGLRRKVPNDVRGGSGKLVGGAMATHHQTRRASDSDKGVFFPDVNGGKRKLWGTAGGMVAVQTTPLETGHQRLNSAGPLSTRTDPG